MYHGEDKCERFKWDRVEVMWEEWALSRLVFKPCEI